MDFSLNVNLRKTVAAKCSEYLVEFCKAVRDPRTMRKLEEAFLLSVSDYADYALLGSDRSANKHAVEIQSLIDRAKELSRKEALKGDTYLSQEEVYILFHLLWKRGSHCVMGDPSRLVQLGYLQKVGPQGETYQVTVKGRDRLSPMTRAAAKRPTNFHELPPNEQFVLNKKLGILGWESPTSVAP